MSDESMGRKIAAEKLNELMPEEKKEAPKTDVYGGRSRDWGGYTDSHGSGLDDRWWDGNRWRWGQKKQPSLWDDDYNDRTAYGRRRTSLADGNDDLEVPQFLRRGGQRPTTDAGHSHERTTGQTTGVRVMKYGKVETPVKITDGVGCVNVAYVSREEYDAALTRVRKALADALEAEGLVWTSTAATKAKQHIVELAKMSMLRKKGPTVTQYYAIEVVEPDGVVVEDAPNDPIPF